MYETKDKMFKKSVVSWLVCASMAIFTSVAATPVLAQDETSLVLEEVIVTAQKRAQLLSDVPISVSVMTGDKIEKAAIRDLARLSEYVPGVFINPGPVNTSINIRGIGSGMNRSFEQSVGMYIDGIYMGRGRQFRAPFLDVERVEILRGPQGILFGRNTIAGAINITTRSPEVGGETEGFVSAKYEPEYDTRVFTGAVSVPLGERFAMRVAGKLAKSDGFITNVPSDSPAIQPDDKLLRVTLVGDPTEKLNINFKYSHSQYETTGTALTPAVFKLIIDPNSPLAPLAFGLSAMLQPDLLDPDRDPFNSYIEPFPALGQSGPEGTNTKTDNVSLTLNYQLDSGAVFTSVTGYSKFDAIDSQDVDFLPIRLLTRYDDRQFDQISQEFRFVSSGGEKLDYIVGLYADQQDLEFSGQIALDGSLGGLTNIVPGVPSIFFPLPFKEISRNNSGYKMDAESFAVFGEATYNVTDAVRISVGGRFSRESKDVRKTMFLGSDVTSAGAPSGLQTPSDDPYLAFVWNGPPFYTFTHDVTGHRSNNHFDPSVKAQWDVSEDHMLYASYSHGFKSGGFNSSDDLNPTILAEDGSIVGFEYDDETADSIEIGLKSSLADGRARLNLAVFNTKYDNLQVSTFQGTTFSVSNAAAAKVKGVEADFQWRATEFITLNGAVSYLDFGFTDYATAGCTAAQIAAFNIDVIANPGNHGPNDRCQQDLSGRTNAFAPEWSGSLGANYYKRISNKLALNVDLDMNFRSEVYIDYDLDEDAKQDAFSKFNARIAIESSDGVWWVAAFGLNLTDEVTYGFSVDTPLVTGSHSAVINPGRIIGLEAGYRF